MSAAARLDFAADSPRGAPRVLVEAIVYVESNFLLELADGLARVHAEVVG